MGEQHEYWWQEDFSSWEEARLKVRGGLVALGLKGNDSDLESRVKAFERLSDEDYWIWLNKLSDSKLEVWGSSVCFTDDESPELDTEIRVCRVPDEEVVARCAARDERERLEKANKKDPLTAALESLEKYIIIILKRCAWHWERLSRQGVFGSGGVLSCVVEELDKLEAHFSNPAFHEVKNTLIACYKKADLSKLNAERIPWDEFVLVVTVNMSGDILESGRHHMYRGVLNPLGDGPNLLRLYHSGLELMVERGIIDTSRAEEEKGGLRRNMSLAG